MIQHKTVNVQVGGWVVKYLRKIANVNCEQSPKWIQEYEAVWLPEYDGARMAKCEKARLL